MKHEEAVRQGRQVSMAANKHCEELWAKLCNAAIAVEPFRKVIKDFEWNEEQRPSTKTLVKAEEVAWTMVEKEAAQADKVTRACAATRMKVDLDSKDGGLAHKTIKAVQGTKMEWTPPTSHQDGHITADPIEIQTEFVRIWAEKVFNEQRTKPSWTDFKEKFGRFVPNVPFTAGHITGKNLYESVKQMGQTVPGLDGWRVKELQALPFDAWQLREEVVIMQMKTNTVPESYRHIGAPMMPKAKTPRRC